MDIEKSFEILKLRSDVSVDELKQSFRDMVNVWHPDRFQHNPRLKEKAEKQLQEINQAYETALAYLTSNPKSASNKMADTSKQPPKKHPDPKPVQEASPFYFSMPVWMVRFLARGMDGIIFALMLGYMEVFRIFRDLPAGVWLFACAASLLWVFIESNLLSIWGTTPGKWIFGIRLVNHLGNKPMLLESFQRSIGVWWYGLGAGCIAVTPLTLAANCLKLIRNRPARWDIKGRFIVIIDHRSSLKTICALAIMFLGSVLLLEMWKGHRGVTISDVKFQTQNESFRPAPPLNRGTSETASVSPSPAIQEAVSRQPVSRPVAPVILKSQEIAYFVYIRKAFQDCAQEEVCRPSHSEALMRETLLSSYGLCGGSCDNLDLLPDGLRFIGVSGTVQHLKQIFESIDDYFGLQYENRALGHYNPEAVYTAQKKLTKQIQELSLKQYQAEEPKLLAFINDYQHLSEEMYRQRPGVIHQLLIDNKRLQEQEAARKELSRKQFEDHRKLLLAGSIPITNLEDAAWYYHAEDGMHLIYNPPLSPLSPDLLKPYYLVSGEMDGIDSDNDKYYRVIVKNQDRIYYFRFRLEDKVEIHQFRVGQLISIIGKLTDSYRYISKEQDVRYMPVFDASFAG